jgi:hypothetical protein
MKKLKFNEGGDIGNRIMEMRDEKMRKAAEKEYDKAMPEADVAFGTLKNMASRAKTAASEAMDSDEAKKAKKALEIISSANPTMGAMRDAGRLANKGADRLMKEGKKRSRNTGETSNPMGDSYARGGKVGSASKRADGCATKGKTKGTMVKMAMGGRTC